MINNDGVDEEAYLSAWHLASGSVLPMALKAAIELGLLEMMAKVHEQEGIPLLTSFDIAARLCAKNPDAPALLERLLRLLASHSILTYSATITTDNDNVQVQWRYGLGDKSRFLFRYKSGGSFGPLLLLLQDKVYMEPWYHLKDAVLQGGVPFHRAFGLNFFDYHVKDPRFNDVFNKAMHHHSTLIMENILDVYNGFHGLRSLVDVGGGTGANLSLVTAKYPQIKGINFDLPHIIQEAPKFPGVQHVGGDMFSSVPSGDSIFMKWILHAWNDEYCLKLLENCWKALPENGKVIVVEMVVPETLDNSLSTSAVFQLDLLMLTLTHGGKERTKKEFEGLAKAAGFTGIKAALPENGKVIVMEMVVPETLDNSLSTSAVFQLDLLMLTLTHGGKERTKKEFKGLAKAAGFTGIKAVYFFSNFWVLEFHKNKANIYL